MKNRAIVAGVLILSVAGTLQTASAWEPAAGMTTMQVMQAATTHVVEGKLPEANEKFSWLYDHALAEEYGEPGIQQANLLPEWAKLARHYPPAMDAVLLAREKLVTRVAAGGQKSTAAMLTLTKVNAQLKDPASTRDAFVRLAARDPVLADSAVMFVLPALVSLQDFTLAGQYLTPPIAAAHFERLQRSLQSIITRPAPMADAAMQRSLQRHLDLQLANVVLVLVNTGRRAEAEPLVQRFRAVAGSEATVHHMTQALNGVAPPSDD